MLCQSKHQFVTKISEKNMANFSDALSDCGLFDLGYRGPVWTFDNKKEGVRNVKARLDNGVASSSWSNIFIEATI